MRRSRFSVVSIVLAERTAFQWGASPQLRLKSTRSPVLLNCSLPAPPLYTLSTSKMGTM
jgi:hypothetical protein